MSLALRRTLFLDGERRTITKSAMPARTVGRIYRMNSTEGELWQWAQMGGVTITGPNDGVADSLGGAKAAAVGSGRGPANAPAPVYRALRSILARTEGDQRAFAARRR